MRTREDILEDIHPYIGKEGVIFEANLLSDVEIIAEMLLDIRDLLNKKKGK